MKLLHRWVTYTHAKAKGEEMVLFLLGRQIIPHIGKNANPVAFAIDSTLGLLSRMKTGWL
jgi:hypothetical protein